MFLRVSRKSMICSVHVRAVANSEPKVAVSMVPCFLEDQSIGILLARWRMPVTRSPLDNVMVEVGVDEV